MWFRRKLNISNVSPMYFDGVLEETYRINDFNNGYSVMEYQKTHLKYIVRHMFPWNYFRTLAQYVKFLTWCRPVPSPNMSWSSASWWGRPQAPHYNFSEKKCRGLLCNQNEQKKQMVKKVVLKSYGVLCWTVLAQMCFYICSACPAMGQNQKKLSDGRVSA